MELMRETHNYVSIKREIIPQGDERAEEREFVLGGDSKQ